MAERMKRLVLIDTDVLIDAGRGIEDAVSALERADEQFESAVSAVSLMELIVGCRNKVELRALDQFLIRFRVLPLDEQVSARAVDLLRQ